MQPVPVCNLQMTLVARICRLHRLNIQEGSVPFGNASKSDGIPAAKQCVAGWEATLIQIRHTMPNFPVRRSPFLTKKTIRRT